MAGRIATHLGITEPLPRPLARLLREAVVRHNESERLRVFPAVLHAGVPGRQARTYTIDAADDLDLTLRTDMVEALVRPGIERRRVPLLWLTRPERAGEGAEGEAQVDREWAAAVTAASGELEARLDLVVVTRHSWRDPRSGVGRRWRRPPRRISSRSSH